MFKKRKTTQKRTKPNQEETFRLIQTRAYSLWEKSGRPNGRDVEFWLAAEQEAKKPAKKVSRR